MSFAVQSASVAAPTRAAAHAGVVEHDRGLRAEARRRDAVPESTAPNGRHALLDALQEALRPQAAGAADEAAAADAPSSPSDERAARQAFHAFVHALFAELRPTDAERGHGRGFAWGRTSSADLARRLEALVDRLQGGDAAAVSTTAPASTEPSADDATAAVTDDTTAPTTGDATTPATGSVTVDLPLLSAFRQLLAARDAGAAEGGQTTDATASLVAFLQRVSAALAGDDQPLDPAAVGSLLDVTA